MDPLEVIRQMGIFALVTIVIDTVPLVTAAVYAARPTEGRLALMRPVSLAGLFAGLAGTLNGLLNAAQYLARMPEQAGMRGPLYAGLSEALVPAVFGLTCLTVAWLFVAIGMWRGQRDG